MNSNSITCQENPRNAIADISHWSERKKAIQAAFETARLSRDRELGILALEIQNSAVQRKESSSGISNTSLHGYARYGRFQKLYPETKLSASQFQVRWRQYADPVLSRKHHNIQYEMEIFPLIADDHVPIVQIHQVQRRKATASKSKSIPLVNMDKELLDEIRTLFITNDYEEDLSKLEGLLSTPGSIFAPQSIGVYAHKIREFRRRVCRLLFGKSNKEISTSLNRQGDDNEF